MSDALLLELVEGQKGIRQELLSLRGDVRAMQGDMKAMQTDIAALKTDVGSLKTDVAALKTDVGSLKTDVGSLKTDVAALKTDVTGLKRKVDGQQAWFTMLSERFTALEVTVNTLRGELADWRDLMAHLRDDDVVQRRAIADLSRDLDGIRGRPAPTP